MGSSRSLRLWAVLVPFLLVMVVGIRDFAGAFLDQRKLGEAAIEGTKWAKASGFDPAQITSVAQSATKRPAITVTPVHSCGCGNDTTVTQAACNAACAGADSWSQPYIVVTTSMCYNLTLAWPGLPYCSHSNSQCAATGCTSRQILLSAQSVVLQ